MNPQVTEAVTKALQTAMQIAESKRHTEVGEAHLLAALFSEPQGYFATFAAASKLNSLELLTQLEKLPAATYEGNPKPPVISAGLQAVFQEAQSIAKKWNDTYIATDHLLLSFWKKEKNLLRHGKINRASRSIR